MLSELTFQNQNRMTPYLSSILTFDLRYYIVLWFQVLKFSFQFSSFKFHFRFSSPNILWPTIVIQSRFACLSFLLFFFFFFSFLSLSFNTIKLTSRKYTTACLFFTMFWDSLIKTNVNARSSKS
jgi:hypothetical protein